MSKEKDKDKGNKDKTGDSGKDDYKIQNLKSDGLFKSVFGTKIAAREFLEEYLPESFRALVDLGKIEVTSETYVEEDLQKRMSDVVYKVGVRGSSKGKEGKRIIVGSGGGKDYVREAFIYCLIEHTSTVDHLMAYRVWKYVLLLLGRYIEENKIDGKKRVRLPLVFPLVLYAGKNKYTAARNLWEMFEEAEMARDVLGSDYALVDLQSMDDGDIKKDQHIAIVKYMLKHIKDRDLVKVWENMFKLFPNAILLDKKKDYVYVKKLLWYSDARLGVENEEGLKRVLESNLDKNEGNKVMKTIADKYREEGIAKERFIMAQKMLSKNKPEQEIAEFTDLSLEQIKKLKNRL